MTSTTTCNFLTPLQVQSPDGSLAMPSVQNANYAFGSSSCVTISDSGTINGFLYGDVLIAFFLMVLVLQRFFGGIINQVAGVRLRDFKKKNYDARDNDR